MKIHVLIFASKKNVGKITQKNIDLLRGSAEKLGHKVVVIYINECQMKFGKKPDILVQNHHFKKINAVIVKANPAARNLAFRSTFIRQFELLGVPVVNKEAPVMRAKNKIRTLQVLNMANVPVPKTYVVADAEYIDDVVDDIGTFPIILKTVSGSHGQGVTIISKKDDLRSIIDLVAHQNISEPIMLQEYVKESKGKDLRIFVVGQRIVGAMERVAQRKGEFRSNFHLGGRVKIASLTKKEKEVAVNAVKACRLDFAGVDILRTTSGPKVIEVNANPGLEGITLATGKDIPGELIKYTVRKVQRVGKTYRGEEDKKNSTKSKSNGGKVLKKKPTANSTKKKDLKKGKK